MSDLGEGPAPRRPSPKGGPVIDYDARISELLKQLENPHLEEEEIEKLERKLKALRTQQMAVAPSS